MKLGIIAEKIDAILEGDAEIEINGLESIDNAMSGDITFLTNSKYYEFINITNASAIIVKNDFSKKSMDFPIEIHHMATWDSTWEIIDFHRFSWLRRRG